MNNLKKNIIKIMWSILLWSVFFVWTLWAVPTFDDIESWLSDHTWNLSEISASNELMRNLQNVILDSNSNWPIYTTVLNVWVWFLLIYLVRWWIMLIFSADNESELKKFKMNLLYIIYWAFLFFWASWIVNYALNIESLDWLNASWWLVDKFQNNLLLQILLFLKMAAYFVAIVMVVYYWFRMMKAFDQEDKIKEARKWIINVVLALVFVKIIDFLFFIAQQEDFSTRAKDSLASITKLMAYVLWAIFLLVVFYAWFLMVTSMWSEESWKKSKNYIKWVFIISLVIFLFLLIAYQIVDDFT